MTPLHEPYDGRVAAFDHHSVSVTPKENADLFAGLVPDGAVIELDLVTHSRGGLVGREIAGEPAPDRHGLVMVAPQRRHRAGRPRAPLRPARPYHRPGPVRARQRRHRDHRPRARGAQAAGRRRGGRPRRDHGDGPERGLPREAERRPAPAAALRAVAADYEPPQGAPLARVARDGATDLVFTAVDNDLVVPTGGCWDVDGAPGFPIDERLVLHQSRSVDHNSFFRQPEVSVRRRVVALHVTHVAARRATPSGARQTNPSTRRRRGWPSRGTPGGTRGSRRGPWPLVVPGRLGCSEVGLDLGDGVLELGDHVVGPGGLLGVGARPALLLDRADGLLHLADPALQVLHPLAGDLAGGVPALGQVGRTWPSPRRGR